MNENKESAMWVLGGTAAIVALYQLLRSRAGTTETMPVPPVRPPSDFESLNAVATRFGQVRELYRMGYISAVDTVQQLDGLLTAIDALRGRGQADSATVVQLTSSINAFIAGLNVA